jgi:putative redox protein
MASVRLSLDWTGDLKFRNSPDSPAMELDSSAPGVTSPPQALAYALMACMAMDVVDILRKGRHEPQALNVRFDGERAADHPRRFVSMRLDFAVTAQVERHVVERAIELSRTKYCSVWNTLRQDVVLTTTFSVREPA